MRGTLLPSAVSRPSLGIIPAYAGNTAVLTTEDFFFWDHPRVCGEHSSVVSMVRMEPGSSPRMRGTLANIYTFSLGEGIIPAYAGNTCVGRQFGQHFRDHPRVCGEHLANGLIGVMVRGSSPRMRGTRG